MRKAGESLNVDGPTPIRLTLGRQSAVSQITYNGDVIDLAPLSSNNISKFSLPLNR
jgi:cytoskeleton protein RodZ